MSQDTTFTKALTSTLTSLRQTSAEVRCCSLCPAHGCCKNGAASGDIALIYYDQTSEEWEEADLTEISANTKYAMYIADLPQYTRYAIVSEDTWGIQ